MNKKSVFNKYCPSCDKCGKTMDHPPISIPVDRAFFEKTSTDLKPKMTVPVLNICRECLLVAIAPIDTPEKDHPDAGWWYRLVENGKLEPLGTMKDAGNN
jgi:hypothetical protein